MSVIFVVVLCATDARAQATGSAVTAPRGGPIVIDGRVDDAEWRAATRIEHPAGTVVRLQRDVDYLYLGITSDRPGFASLCLTQGIEVHILHASAALGAVTYRPNAGVWQSADTAFRYGMRNTALDDSARAQREAYLSEHGWVASTVRMGVEQRTQEMKIALTRFPLPFSIALARWLIGANSTEWWPATITDHDGCFAMQLVRGGVPQGLMFKPGYWLTIENK